MKSILLAISIMYIFQFSACSYSASPIEEAESPIEEAETVTLSKKDSIVVPKPSTPEGELAVKLLQVWMNASEDHPEDPTEATRSFDQKSIQALYESTIVRIKEQQLLQHDEMVIASVEEATVEGDEFSWALDRVVKDIKPKPPVEVDVNQENWRVAFTFQYSYNTSDDWNYYSNTVLDTLKKKNIITTHLQFGQTQVLIKSGGKTLHTVTVPQEFLAYGNVGYIFAKKDGKPQFVEHEMEHVVLQHANKVFGLKSTP